MHIFGFGATEEVEHNKKRAYWIPERDDDVDIVGKAVTEKWLEKRDRKPLITQKNERKLEIQRYLPSIRKHLEAIFDHSPEELESELLQWGYRKFFK